MVCNSVIFIGRLTDDPVLRKSESGVSSVRFTLAVQRRTDKDTADFIPCLAFQKTAELMSNYLNKGSRVAIEGHFQSGKYERDSEIKYTLDCVVDSFQMLDSKKQDM